jgi:hypothetical protein
MRTVGILAIVSMLGLAAGCVQKQQGDHPVAQAIPMADDVRVNVPEAQMQNQALGQLADYYVITRNLSRDLNRGAGWVLVLVHTIVHYPYTERDGNSYTWGPWSDTLEPAEYKLVVVDNGNETYDWSLEGKSKIDGSMEFTPVIYGYAKAGATPHRGSGNFTIDFDAGERVNPVDNQGDMGVVDVVYDLENRDNTPALLDIHVDSFQADEDGTLQPVSWDYNYAENFDGSGDLSFGVHGDLDENDDDTLFEDALIRSRWLTDGSGRADIMVSGGDLVDMTVTASECWDDSFSRVFYGDSEDWVPSEGDEADCAFADQDLPGA